MKVIIARLYGFWKYKDLLGQLVLRDLKLKYRRSFLGYLWSILSPLMTMMVMVAVFSSMFSRNIENFPVYLITGQIMFNFMNNATHQAMTSIVANATLIKKAYLPKYIFAVAKITSGFIDFIFSLGALVLVMIFTKASISWHIILFPLVVVQLYIFCVGLGLFLAQANVFFRDLQYIYSVVTLGWMYLTPIFYPLEALHNSTLVYIITRFNPMYYYIIQFRDLVLYHNISNIMTMFLGFLIAGLMLIVGMSAFIHNQEKFILYI